MSKGLWMAAVAIALVSGSRASAAMRITEYQYNGSEYVEFTNTGVVAIDVTGWSFDDAGRTPDAQVLTYGLVGPGESVLLSEDPAATFKALWNLAASVKVIGGNTNNLGGGDEINLYDASDNLVDRLTYAAATGPVALNVSANPKAGALGANAHSQWVLSSVGDAYGSYTSTSGLHIGNPGIFNAPVPEPGSASLALIGLLGLVRRRRLA